MTGWLDSHSSDCWDLLTPEQQQLILESEEAPDEQG